MLNRRSLLRIDVMTEEVAEALYDTGCGDSSPSSRGGRAYAASDRDADSVESAVANVRATDYGIDHVQIEDADLAGLSAVGNAAN